MKNKTNYALFELAILVLSLSGCRFGNFTEPPKQSSMKIWELGLEAKSFETIVISRDVDANGNNVMIRNPNTPMVGIPSSVDASFPNPVALVFPGDSSSPFFYNFANQFALSTTINAQNVIEDAAGSNVVQLWSNPNCKTQLQIYQDGTIDFNKTDAYVDSSGKSKKTDGRLKLELMTVRAILGTSSACLADLKTLASCYQDPSSCDAQTFNAATSLYDVYVRFGGVLTLDDTSLSKIQGLAYIVKFE